MANPPKKSVGTTNNMVELNARLQNAEPRNRDDAMYPLFVKFTHANDTTHLQRSLGPFTRYDRAAAALNACNDEPRVRLACIIDSEGQPVA